MREAIKAVFRAAGLSVRRLQEDSHYTLLGLRRQPVGAVIDVGANEGQFARWALDVFPAARIWCFEPMREPFSALATWASTCPHKVFVHNVALGDTAGDVEMWAHLDHSPSSSTLASTRQNERLFPKTARQEARVVRMCRLDDFALAEELARSHGSLVLLKADVQGVEDRVLRGAVRTLQVTDFVLVEVSLDRLYDGQATFAGLVALLAGHGFTYRGNVQQAYASDDHVVYVDALFGREQ